MIFFSNVTARYLLISESLQRTVGDQYLQEDVSSKFGIAVYRGIDVRGIVNHFKDWPFESSAYSDHDRIVNTWRRSKYSGSLFRH